MPMATEVDYRLPTLRPQLWGRAADNYIDLDLGNDRWAGTGTELVPIGCPTITARPEYICQSIDFVTPEGFQNSLKFNPFRIEESITCSTLGAWSPEELQDWLLREARAIYSAALARQVWGGAYTTGNPTATISLQANAVDVTSPQGLTPLDALSAVEYGLGQRLLGQGMVHMTVDVLTRLKSTGVVERVGDQYFTPSGHIVVADYGYYNNSANATNYVYGSGMVYYQTKEFALTTAFKSDHNDIIVRAVGYAVVEFETCPLVKAAVNVATPANYGGV